LVLAAVLTFAFPVVGRELNSECRARGLLTIFAALAPTEKLAFATMLKDKHGMQKAVDRFLQVRTDKSDAVTDALMDIARRLPAQDEAFANVSVAVVSNMFRFSAMHSLVSTSFQLQELLDYKDKLIFTGLDRLCTANLPLSETVRIAVRNPCVKGFADCVGCMSPAWRCVYRRTFAHVLACATTRKCCP
jgi:hypothetical protein